VKTPKYSETVGSHGPIMHIESFTERLKKSFDLEVPSPLAQSFDSNHQQTLYDIEVANPKPNERLNSPMKRLRLEELHADKPKKELNSSVTSDFNECLKLLNEAETKVHSRFNNQVQGHPDSLNSSSFLTSKSTSKKTQFLSPNKYHQNMLKLNQDRRFFQRNNSISTTDINFSPNSLATKPDNNDLTNFTIKTKTPPNIMNDHINGY
jgi:hypothetical protein